MNPNIKSYIDEHQQRFLDELLDLLRIPSVSADSKFKDDVLKAADYLKQALEHVGVDFVEICPTAGHPIVYAEKIVDPALPTVLVYGHYDVQPADPYELWDSPPFEPVIKENKIYARGACDDKGQLYMHVKALEIMMDQGNPPCNIKFMFEGEEEVGSSNLEVFVREQADRLAADVILISDTAIISNDTPSITVGLRGLSYVEVEVTGPNRDLHSGVYGGAVANPVNVLCTMILAGLACSLAGCWDPNTPRTETVIVDGDTINTKVTNSEGLMAPDYQLVDLTPELKTHIGEKLTEAEKLIIKYHSEVLDQVFESWLNSTESSKESPEYVVEAIGAAFGQDIVNTLNCEWKILTDEAGTDLTVIHKKFKVNSFPFSSAEKAYMEHRVGSFNAIKLIFKKNILDSEAIGVDERN